jgi:phage-related protein
MAAGSRTLKLSILGDVDNLNKSLKSATADVETFGDKMGKVGKAIGAAFVAAAAAAAAYAVKIGIDGVKAAIADEKAQTQLALALENATGATTAQIAATEQSILQMSLASGVADDTLRPALGRLVRSTGDITKAQDLLSTALDISTATGKPLESVANALSRAYDGNTTSLGKLGIGLSSAELKTMSFEQVQAKLSDLFGGAAAANADTYAGKIARMQVAFDEAKETIGFALLPILEKVMNFINANALPAIQAFSNAFSLEKGGLGGVITSVGNIMVTVFTPIIEGLIKAFGYIKDAVVSNLDSFQEFGFYIETYLAPIIGTVLGGALQVVGKIAGGIVTIISNVVSAINGLIGVAIAGINAVISAYNAIPILPNISQLATPPTPSVSSGSSAGVSAKPSITTTGVKTASASASQVTASIKNLSPAASAGVSAAARQDAAMAARGGNTINLTVNGAIDKEGTARSIVDTLNNSFFRGGGGGANALVMP